MPMRFKCTKCGRYFNDGELTVVKSPLYIDRRTGEAFSYRFLPKHRVLMRLPFQPFWCDGSGKAISHHAQIVEE